MISTEELRNLLWPISEKMTDEDIRALEKFCRAISKLVIAHYRHKQEKAEEE